MKIGLIYQRNCLEEQRREVIFVDSEKEIYDYVRDKGYYSFEYCIIDNGIEQILNEVLEELEENEIIFVKGIDSKFLYEALGYEVYNDLRKYIKPRIYGWNFACYEMKDVDKFLKKYFNKNKKRYSEIFNKIKEKEIDI